MIEATPNETTSNKKRVIALSCSPSKGRNSDTMLDAFIKGVSTNENIEVVKMYANDIVCDNYSYEHKDGALSHEPLLKEFLEKVTHAEGLVIATPTYNFGVPAGLKNLIDRMRPIALDFTSTTRLGQPKPALGYLSTYFLVTGGTPNWAHNIVFFAFPGFWLRGVFLYYGAKCMGTYYSGDVRSYENQAILNACEMKGKKYGYKLVNRKSQGILERIFFRPPEREF